MSGALQGTGVLAIWNGIAPGHEAEFLRWHVTEHIPERLSVPGFLRARRYVALSGHPAYFNFYELAEPAVLRSDAYLARLGDPTEWTRSVVSHFTDTSRTFTRVVESHGYGIAGTICALRIDAAADPIRPMVAALADDSDVSAAHLLEEDEGPASATAESALRDRPDETAATILLAEGPSAVALEAAVTRLASDAGIAAANGAQEVQRGTYQLDFFMDRQVAV